MLMSSYETAIKICLRENETFFLLEVFFLITDFELLMTSVDFQNRAYSNTTSKVQFRYFKISISRLKRSNIKEHNLKKCINVECTCINVG